MLEINESIQVVFAFKPMSQMVLQEDVLFEPNSALLFRLKMFGSGGVAKASLSHYDDLTLGIV